jgi:hypothetical protein
MALSSKLIGTHDIVPILVIVIPPIQRFVIRQAGLPTR